MPGRVDNAIRYVRQISLLNTPGKLIKKARVPEGLVSCVMTSYLQDRTLYPPLIEVPPAPDLACVLVIPCYCEPQVDALDLIAHCHRPSGSVELIILINQSQNAGGEITQANTNLFKSLQGRADLMPSWLQLHVIYLADLPEKKAGVGMARKIAMDEAVRRFEALGRDGLIINLDADCTIQPNYFTAIETHFAENVDGWSAGIKYEHAISDLADDAPIVLYELHLRYFVKVQRWAGLPFAYQTLGSCMVVRSQAYQKMGGMNKRQAGEDFYFLQKFIEVGRHTELFTTTVVPSARRSDRVPFGTGRAIGQIQKGQEQMTSAWQVFIPVKSMLENVSKYLDDASDEPGNPPGEPLLRFLQQNNWEQKLVEIRENSASAEARRDRFYKWFNSFRVMKYAHFASEFIPDVRVRDLANSDFPGFLQEMKGLRPKEVLQYLRNDA